MTWLELASSAASSAAKAGVSGLAPIAGLVDAAGSLFDAAGSWITNRRNIKNWRMVNEYNSPKAQMQRFAEAGLNPNLIYGNITGGNAQQLPAMQQPHFKPGFADTLLKYKDARIRDAQADQIRANTEAIRARTKIAKDSYDLKKSKFDFDQSLWGYIREGKRLDNQNKEYRGFKALVDMGVSLANARKIYATIDYIEAQTGLVDIKADIQQALYDFYYKTGQIPNNPNTIEAFIVSLLTAFRPEVAEKVRNLLGLGKDTPPSEPQAPVDGDTTPINQRGITRDGLKDALQVAIDAL